MSTKQIHRLVLFFGLAALLGLLAACGGQSESETPANTPAAAATQASAETEDKPTPLPAATAAAPTLEDTAPQAELQQATTVRQAAQMLNLAALPLPEGAELMDKAEAGQLTYQAPLEVAAVVDFYRSLLTEQGWQENSEQSYIDPASSTLYFSKEGYQASLSASQSSDGQAMVTLMHHGNINLAALPQMADAEQGFAAPNTLIYVSPSSVADVVKFTRQELAALGWHEYTRPNTTSADNPDTQTLTFIQNGLELTSFITVAPAQDNKTSVQYSLALLLLDLPLPDDATQVEFDQTEPYLSFRSQTGMEALLEFYRGAMTELGWTEIADSAHIGPEESAVAFAHEQAEQAMALSLTSADGGLKAALQPFSAEALTETEPGDTSEEETGAASGAMPDLPVPEDAQDVAFDADAGEITFTSPSNITTLADFYRKALPAQGWQEDADFSIVEDTFGSLEFSRGEDSSLSITLFPDVINQGTQVTLSVSGLAGTEETVVEPAETAPAAAAPGYTINDWPFPPEAVKVNRSGDELTYTIAQDLQTVADFYRPTFELMELGTSCLEDVGDYTSISCSTSNGDYSLNFFAFEAGDNETEVEISFVNQALGPSDSSGGGDSDELTAVDQDGLPIPSDESGYSSEGSPFNRRLSFTSPSDVETLLGFYQLELPKLGWSQVGEASVSGDTTSLTFEGPDGKLTVALTSSGGETEGVLQSKNPKAAAEAGILPPAGQARIYMVNFSSEELTVTLNDQVIKVAAEAGTTSPDDAPKLDLPPGTYEVTTQAGGSSVTDKITVGADEVWSLVLDPSGAAPLQMY